jgi:hypothetical protein
MNTLINKRAVKSFAMKVAADRHHRFTQVGQCFYDKVEGLLRHYIRDHIHRLPSSGRTIR